jgi:sugar phosphate permease
MNDGQPTTSAARPTAVRFGVLALSVSMAVILYLDRMAINVAMPAIIDDLDIPLSYVADSVAAFFWSYALLQIPAGWLGDRWGGRRALTLYVAAWSLAIAGLGLVNSLATLVLMRGLLGVAQAGAYSTTASFLRRWMPFSSRGIANSSVSLGGRAGGVLAPSVTAIGMAAVALAGWETATWRPVFFAYALVGWAWAVIFWTWFRDSPTEHPRVNEAERQLIEAHPAEVQAAATAPQSAAAASLEELASSIGTSPSIWFLIVVNFFINLGWVLLGMLLPTYLNKEHGWSLVEAGFAASAVALGGMAGCLVGGIATDVLVRRLNLVWGRRVPCLVSYGGASIAYVCCFAVDDPKALVAILVVASFLGDFGLGPLWCTYQDLGGPYSGTVLGVGNMAGNIGAAIGLSLVPRLANEFGWSASFALSVFAYGIAALVWLAIDPRKSIYARLRSSAL